MNNLEIKLSFQPYGFATNQTFSDGRS